MNLKKMYVVLYVDDHVIATAMNSFKLYLTNKFLIVDLKETKLYLGIKFTCENIIIKIYFSFKKI